jgi:hypothetical protein
MLLTALACASVSARSWELVVAGSLLVVFAFLSRGASHESVDERFALGLGLTTPTLAWSGSRVILIVSLVFFLVRWWRDARVGQSRALLWAAPLLIYLLGNLVGELAVVFDLLGGGRDSFTEGVQVDGSMRGMDLLRTLCDVHAPSWNLLARVLLLACVADFFMRQDSAKRSLMKGVVVGSTVSATFAISQWLGLMPLQLSNQTPFWSSLGRVAGLLSDPNALGVVMVLSLWMVALMPREDVSVIRWRLLCWVGLVVGAGIVSGSRTFLLGGVLLCAALGWSRSQRLFVGSAMGLCAAIVIVTLLDSSALISGVQNTQRWLPQGVLRGVSALSLYRLSETFGSRTLFFDLVSAVGSGRWLFGLGADRFREYVPLIGMQSGLIHKWTDNANNLYLALLVELGILGCMCACLVLAARSINRTLPAKRSVWGCIALALMMATGPHTDFIEVVVLVGVFVSLISKPRDQMFPGFSIISVTAGVAGFAASFMREQGAYTWWEQQGGAARWLSHRAQIELVCEQYEATRENASSATLSARTLLEPMYIPQREPLKVVVIGANRFSQELEFSFKERRELRVPCSRLGERLLVTVVTKPPWSPYRAWPRSSGDRRILGVQQVELARFAHRVSAARTNLDHSTADLS